MARKNNMKAKSMIGVYGAWAASLHLNRPGALSFLQRDAPRLSTWRRKGREKVLELIAMPAEERNPRPRVKRRYNMDGLHVEELAWRLPFGPETEAVFLKPAGAQGRLPSVLALHCHSGNKILGWQKIARTREPISPPVAQLHAKHYGGVAWANELARRGYAVLIHDTFAFASRRVRYPDAPPSITEGRREHRPESLEQINEYNRWAGNHEHVMAKSLFCAGTTWPGVWLYEDQCALDILCARPDVDVSRVACGGLSGGGLRASFLAGLDDRIRAAFTAGFMPTWRDLLFNKSFNHTWMVYVPRLPQFLDFPEIIGLHCPKPTLVLNSRQDSLFTLSEMQAAVRKLQATYRKAGVPEHFNSRFFDGPHKFDLPMQKHTFEWLDQRMR